MPETKQVHPRGFFTPLALPDEPPINWRILFIYLSEGRVWLSEAQASFKPAAK
jgi:hypothetical protein